MSDRPHLFFNNSPCCQNLMSIINKFGMQDDFIYHDVTDPVVLSKIPSSFKRIPILVVKGCSSPLIGKEVFVWVESRQYMNLTSNNITKSSNPEFYVDPTIGKPYDNIGAAIDDKDDDKFNTTMVYLEDWDKLISNNVGKKFKDTKITVDDYERQLNKLNNERNTILTDILDKHKNF